MRLGLGTVDGSKYSIIMYSIIMKATFLACLFLLLPCGWSQVQLHYALLTASGSGGFSSLGGVVPAIELAQEMVNGNSTLLSNYTFTHTGVLDTKCDRTKSLELFLDTVSLPSPTVLGLVGCGCSVASAPVAEIVGHFNIPQVSYISMFSEASDRTRFSNFFRTIPSDGGFGPAIVSLLHLFNWERIAVFTQQDGLFNEAWQRFSRDFKQANITLKNRMISPRKTMRSGNSTNFFFEDENFRVFFLNVNSKLARQILCQALMRDLTAPRYVWITYGWYQEEWWRESKNSVCSNNQLAGIVERGLALQLFPRSRHPEVMTDTGLTPRQFDALYRERLKASDVQDNSSFTFGASLAYDAVWTLAFALNKVSELIISRSKGEVVSLTGCNESGGGLVALENFTYENEQMGCVIRWAMEQTHFVGVSGSVDFDDMGSRVQSGARLLQYRADTSALRLVLVAETTVAGDSLSNFSYVINETNTSVFPGSVSSDGRRYTQKRTFYLELVVVNYSLATLGLVLCTVCLVFNCTQRNKKVVRLTSPVLNYLILAGISIIYVSIFFRVMPSTEYLVNAARCSVNIVLTNLGYCLAFGTLLAKMGRVYYIFHNPTISKKTLKDWHLVIIILGITGFGFALGVLHVSVPQLRIDAVLKEDGGYGVGRDDDGVEVVYMTYQCDKTEGGLGDIWLLITYVYFGLLQLIGIILAIQTRKVHIKVLNDSKFVTALIYMSSILLLLLGVVVYLFGSYINAVEIVFSGAFLLAATTFASLSFIPKMVNLYRDPMGDKIFEGGGRGTTLPEGTLPGVRSVKLATQPSIDGGVGFGNEGMNVARLQLKVRELERLLRDTQLSSSQSDNSIFTDSTTHLVDSPTPPSNQNEAA